MLYKNMLKGLLENKEPPTEKRSVLYIRFPSEVLFSNKKPSSVFSYVHTRKAHLIVCLEKYTSEILSHPTGLIAFFSDRNDALFVGLELMSQYLCISLDIGDGWIVEDETWVGVARWRSEHMSHFVPPNQFWVSKSFLQDFKTPDGIGFFDGNKKQIAAMGISYCEIKDYRCI